MAMDKLTRCKKCSQALFELSQKKGAQEVVFKEMKALNYVFSENPKLAKLLDTEILPLAEKKKLMDILTKQTGKIITNFLGFLFETKEFADFPLLFETFNEIYWSDEAVIEGRVTSVYQLSDETKRALEAAFEHRFSFEHVVLKREVDEEIIGGVIVEIDGKLIDGSIKKQLTKIKHLLKME